MPQPQAAATILGVGGVTTSGADYGHTHHHHHYRQASQPKVRSSLSNSSSTTDGGNFIAEPSVAGTIKPASRPSTAAPSTVISTAAVESPRKSSSGVPAQGLSIGQGVGLGAEDRHGGETNSGRNGSEASGSSWTGAAAAAATVNNHSGSSATFATPATPASVGNWTAGTGQHWRSKSNNNFPWQSQVGNLASDSAAFSTTNSSSNSSLRVNTNRFDPAAPSSDQSETLLSHQSRVQLVNASAGSQTQTTQLQLPHQSVPSTTSVSSASSLPLHAPAQHSLSISHRHSRNHSHSGSNSSSGYGSGTGSGSSSGPPGGAPPRTSSLLPPPLRHPLGTITAEAKANSRALGHSHIHALAAVSSIFHSGRDRERERDRDKDREREREKERERERRRKRESDSGAAAALLLEPASSSSSPSFLDRITSPALRRANSHTHSRASSFGATSDGLRNLNRWSASTSSSRASLVNRGITDAGSGSINAARPTNFSRRLSVDSVALLASQSPSSSFPRKSSSVSSRRQLSLSGNNSHSHSHSHNSSSSSNSNSSSRSFSRDNSLRGSRGFPTAPLPPASTPSHLHHHQHPHHPHPHHHQRDSSNSDVGIVPTPRLPPGVGLPSLEFNGTSSTTASAAASRSPSALAVRSRGGDEYVGSGRRGHHAHKSSDVSDRYWNEPTAPLASGNDVVDMADARGHHRSRSSASGRSISNSYINSKEREKERDKDKDKDKDRSKPSQKAMLSKALTKANMAVQLDNAQKYQNARESYLEACELLQQVLVRTNGEEDRKKLEAIRGTYTSRIEELDEMLPSRHSVFNGKPLPSSPRHEELREASNRVDEDLIANSNASVNDQTAMGMQTAIASRYQRAVSPDPLTLRAAPAAGVTNTYTATANASRAVPASNANLGVDGPGLALQSAFSKSPRRRNFETTTLSIPRTEDTQFVPAPLSPMRSGSPRRADDSPDDKWQRGLPSHSAQTPVSENEARGEQNQDVSNGDSGYTLSGGYGGYGAALTAASSVGPTHEGMTWLDPIDESGTSAPSSVHSRDSSFGMRRKHIRAASGTTEAEFDAALDAAVEAAYDDGYEPMDDDDDVVSQARQRIMSASERLQDAEREAAIQRAHDKERQRTISHASSLSLYDKLGFYNDSDDDDEEEERILDMARGLSSGSSGDYYGHSRKPSQSQRTGRDRESDSSGVTQRTWHSSMGSNPASTSTMLSTVTEIPPSGYGNHGAPAVKIPGSGNGNGTISGNMASAHTTNGICSTASMPPPPPPPSQALPQLPPSAAPIQTQTSGTRSRRQSGANLKQLKIETSKLGLASANASASKPRYQGISASVPASTSPSGATSPVHPTPIKDVEEYHRSNTNPSSPLRQALRKNKSSSSLKSTRSRHQPTDDISPHTPLTLVPTNTTTHSRAPAVPTLPASSTGMYNFKLNASFGGFYLFDTDMHIWSQQLSLSNPPPNIDPDVPLPLEPCPSDVMLRPFWLMRALYQTLVHPRGGYLTNRLFVPRDVWKVKGVKLKNVEDKCAQADLLTAALYKLARVDSTDADEVLDEMQNLENILEQVQTTLTRRLGSEVGTTGMAANTDDAVVPNVPRSASVSNKGGAFSWRRLRNKGSAVNLASAYGGKSTSGGSTGSNSGVNQPESSFTSGTLASLPMVANPLSKTPKREVNLARFDGPWAGYMTCLAKLFDAVQTVDQIARQVEDPGLRHADKTQVGLELCTRHAAEFFGFYICRFVLSDLGLLLDKYMKRGSEWVLA